METKIDNLIFSSNFDSGNLRAVEKVTEWIDYAGNNGEKFGERQSYVKKFFGVHGLERRPLLKAKPDMHVRVWTRYDAQDTPFQNGNRSWFYFSVRNYKPCSIIRISVMNMNRQAKLFAQGHAPVFKVVGTSSVISAWKRIKEEPVYEIVNGQFNMTFVHQFSEIPNTTTYFAFAYPWSYSESQALLDQIDRLSTQLLATRRSRRPGRRAISVVPGISPESKAPPENVRPTSIYFHREVLCHSLGGRNIDLLTISDHENQLKEREDRFDPLLFPHPENPRPWKYANKKIFVITARVHPGETPGSHMFNGVLEFLLRENDKRAIELRRQYVFKLIPMLNPDGVVLGHYRTDSRGVNLNRVYLTPNYLLYPSIYAVKALIAYHHIFYGEKMAYPGSISPETFEKFVMLSKKCRQILDEPEKFGLPNVTPRQKPRYEEPVCMSGDVRSEGHELPKLYSPEGERFNSAEPYKKDLHRLSRYSCCPNQMQLDGSKSNRDCCINGPRIQTSEARYLESPVVRHPVEYSQTTTSSLKGKIMKQYFSEQDWVSVFLDESQPPNISCSRQSELALRLPTNISSSTTIPQCHSVEVSLSSMRRTPEEEEFRHLTSETSKSSTKMKAVEKPSYGMVLRRTPGQTFQQLDDTAVKRGSIGSVIQFPDVAHQVLSRKSSDRGCSNSPANRNNCALMQEDSFGFARNSTLSSGRETENASPELRMLIAHQKQRQLKLSQSLESLGRLVNILPPAAGDNRCATPPGFLFGPMRRDLKRNANDAMNCYLNFQHATHPVMFMEYGAYVLNTSTSFAIPHYEEMGRGLLIAALDMWCTNPWSRLANCPCADMLKLKPGTHKTLRALTSPLNSANKYPLSGQKLRMAESVNYKLLRNWARRHTTHLANHEGITFSRKESEPRSQKHDVRLPTTGRSAVLEVVPLTRLRGRNNAPSKTTTEIVCVTPVSTDQPQIRETTDVALHRRIDDPSNITPEIICETPVSTEKSNPWSSIEPEVPAKSRQIDANELTADSVRNQSQSSQKDLKTQCTTSSFLIMPTKRKKLVNGDIAQNAPDGGEPAPKMNHKTVEFFCDGGKAMSENEHSCQSHASLLPEPSPRIRQGQCERRASLRSDFGVPRPSFSPRMPDLEFGFDASKVVRPLLQRPSRWESGKTPKPRSEKQCGKAPEPGPSEGRTVLLSRRGSLPARSPHPNKLVALEPPKRCLEKPTPRKVNSSTNNARKSTLDSHSTNIRPTVASVVIKSLDGGMVAYKGLAELDRREINRMLRKTDSCQPKIAHPKVAKRASSRNLAITAYTKREQPKPTAKSPGLIRDRTVNAFSTAPLDGKRKTLKRSKSNLAPRSRQQPSAVNANATPLERLTPAFTPRTLRLRRTTHLPRLKSTEPPAFPSITTGPVWTNIY
uniref:Cytosolic carboxypeptidase-like protein 5 n=1 Tax=Schistocephalus solidus TaxID=70667 RepID=A0A0X3Q3J8_SCHSO